MFSENPASKNLSGLLKYLAQTNGGAASRLPSLHEIARELGISIASLREQLEVARVMGLVEIRPKTGLRKLDYRLSPILKQSLAYGILVNESLFQEFSDLRKHLETVYWMEAVNLLVEDDQNYLKTLVKSAKAKLHALPIQIPHLEHRELHLSIYSKLGNLFVHDLLEVYWDMYENLGLNQYTDLNYLEGVWDYHERMVNAICEGQMEAGYKALIDHMALINQRATRKPTGNFE